MLSSKDIKKYIERGYLVRDFIDLETQLQPSGFDLTLSKIFIPGNGGSIDFSNEKRKLPELTEIALDNYVDLKPGIYNIVFNEYINLPKEVAAILLPRSSALSCGIEVHTALWDPGYHGRGLVYISIGRNVRLYKNARIAQMVFFYVDNPGNEYSGIYKGEDLLKFSSSGNDESKNRRERV